MKIAFLGDSIPKGTDYGGVTTADTFAQKVGLGLGFASEDIINASVGGNTAGQGLSRVAADVTSKGKGVCCVMFGANDFWKNVNLDDYANNLRAIANHLTAEGWTFVFASWPLWRGGPEVISRERIYLETFRAIAGEFGIGFIDICHHYALDYLADEPAWNSCYVPGDEVHQSKAGHIQITTIMLGSAYRSYWALPAEIIVAPIRTPMEELTIACADYLIGGQTPELLSVLQQKRAAIL